MTTTNKGRPRADYRARLRLASAYYHKRAQRAYSTAEEKRAAGAAALAAHDWGEAQSNSIWRIQNEEWGYAYAQVAAALEALASAPAWASEFDLTSAIARAEQGVMIPAMSTNTTGTSGAADGHELQAGAPAGAQSSTAGAQAVDDTKGATDGQE